MRIFLTWSNSIFLHDNRDPNYEFQRCLDSFWPSNTSHLSVAYYHYFLYIEEHCFDAKMGISLHFFRKLSAARVELFISSPTYSKNIMTQNLHIAENIYFEVGLLCKNSDKSIRVMIL